MEDEQRKDPGVMEVIRFLEDGVLPEDNNRARKLALQENLFVIIDRVLYHLDSMRDHHKQVVVPSHLQKSGHFSGQRLFNTLRMRWWWKGMFGDAQQFVKGGPRVCSSIWWRVGVASSIASYSSDTSLSDSRSGCDGPAKNGSR